MLQFDAIGVLGVLAALTSWSFAVVLFRFAATSAVTRMLAFLLVIEGVALVGQGYVDMLLTSQVQALPGYAAWLRFEEIVHTLGDCAMLALYPAFLAMALQTGLTRRLAYKPVRIGFALVAALLFVAVFTTPLEVGATALYLCVTTLFGFALIASIHAWRSAGTALARARARSFTIAFGFRDICWSVTYGGAIWLIFAGKYTISTQSKPSDAVITTLLVVYACGTLFYVPLIAYGILRTHLFDIDLRIRWTIKQSTVAAAVVAIVYLVSEGASRLLSAELGNVAGLCAAAVVVFFMAPLQRFADRVASAAMPNTVNTPEYTAFRKLKVYEATVAEALQGGISQKERVLLTRLRDSLGISPADAAAVEQELAAASN